MSLGNCVLCWKIFRVPQQSVIHLREGDLCEVHRLMVFNQRLTRAAKRWHKESAREKKDMAGKYYLLCVYPPESGKPRGLDTQKWVRSSEVFGSIQSAVDGARLRFAEGTWESVLVVSVSFAYGLQYHGCVGWTPRRLGDMIPCSEGKLEDICRQISVDIGLPF